MNNWNWTSLDHLCPSGQVHPFLSRKMMVSRSSTAKFPSKVDLLKGFHQVPVEPSSRESFSCKHGKFDCKMMPFGLRNAPATFQLLMNGRGIEDFTSPFIDHVIIYSIDWDHHLGHIDAVLARYSEH